VLFTGSKIRYYNGQFFPTGILTEQKTPELVQTQAFYLEKTLIFRIVQGWASTD